MLSQPVLPLVVGGFIILDKAISAMPCSISPSSCWRSGEHILAYLRWARFTYTVGADDIRVESGFCRARRGRYRERIQDVSIEQKFVPRLFEFVEVKFETGAGGGDDLKLAYLPEVEGERLRELVGPGAMAVRYPSRISTPTSRPSRTTAL